jgi:hypothetical protein
MIPMEQVQAALREGYAYPCAMCVKLHWAKDRQLDKCRAAFEGKDCGGPLSGLGFPEYEGQLTRTMIAKTCFRCGQPASKIVEGNKGPGYTGVCKRHLPVLNRVMETGDDPWKPIDSHIHVDRR